MIICGLFNFFRYHCISPNTVYVIGIDIGISHSSDLKRIIWGCIAISGDKILVWKSALFLGGWIIKLSITLVLLRSQHSLFSPPLLEGY